MKKLYVGNLPWSTNEAELRQMFEPMGEVHSCALITDRETVMRQPRRPCPS